MPSTLAPTWQAVRNLLNSPSRADLLDARCNIRSRKRNTGSTRMPPSPPPPPPSCAACAEPKAASCAARSLAFFTRCARTWSEVVKLVSLPWSPKSALMKCPYVICWSELPSAILRKQSSTAVGVAKSWRALIATRNSGSATVPVDDPDTRLKRLKAEFWFLLAPINAAKRDLSSSPVVAVAFWRFAASNFAYPTHHFNHLVKITITTSRAESDVCWPR